MGGGGGGKKKSSGSKMSMPQPVMVDATQYIKRPSIEMESMMLNQKNQQGLMLLKNQAELLKLFSNVSPLRQEFSPNQVSQEAGELGMANLARSRQYEELASPEAAQMRRQLPQRMQEATSRDTWKKQMEEWAKTKGLTALSATGIDPDSTIARSALFDTATQAGREFELGNLAAQQGYLAANAAPTGGLDPGALMSAKQAAETANLETLGGWQSNLLGAAQGINASASDFVNTGTSDMLSLSQADRANQLAYQQMLYQAAAQNAAAQNEAMAARLNAQAGIQAARINANATNAASRNSLTGAYIGAGGAVAGAALGAVII